MRANGQWRFTPPVQVVAALVAALQALEAEGGAPGRLVRYADNLAILTGGMARLGFELYLEPRLQAPIIATFRPPTGRPFDFATLYDGLAERGFLIYPGKLTRGDSFRIGCIGDLHRADFERLLEAVATVSGPREAVTRLKAARVISTTATNGVATPAITTTACAPAQPDHRRHQQHGVVGVHQHPAARAHPAVGGQLGHVQQVEQRHDADPGEHAEPDRQRPHHVGHPHAEARKGRHVANEVAGDVVTIAGRTDAAGQARQLPVGPVQQQRQQQTPGAHGQPRPRPCREGGGRAQADQHAHGGQLVRSHARNRQPGGREGARTDGSGCHDSPGLD